MPKNRDFDQKFNFKNIFKKFNFDLFSDEKFSNFFFFCNKNSKSSFFLKS